MSDDDPVSEGGNIGTYGTFSRKAPKGKFRVVAVDMFDGSDWVQEDPDTLEEAYSIVKEIMAEEEEGRDVLRMYIYNEKGECVYNS